MTTTQKVAFITGAGKGIGLETARELGRQGIQLVLGIRNAEQGQLAVTALENDGIAAELLLFDLSDPNDHQKAYDDLTTRYGRLDILINNAGIWLESESASVAVTTTAENLDMDILRNTMEVNFFNTVALTQMLLPLLRKSPAGRIVNVSSLKGSLGLNAQPGSLVYDVKAFAYDTSKAALNMFTIQLAHALRDTAIKVNTIHPGWVRSAMGGAAANMGLKEGSETSAYYALLDEHGPGGGFFFLDEVIPW